MATVNDIYQAIDSFAPFNTALSFDNCGMLVGDSKCEVNTCIIALDMTMEVLKLAIESKAELIITHHPVIFEPLLEITSNSMVYDTIKAGISIICAHTNLDLAVNGVNYKLAQALKLNECVGFNNKDMLGVVGKLPHIMLADEFAGYVKKELSAPFVRYVDCGRRISSVAVIGGEGSDYLYESKIADAYLTGEVKHHIYSYAQNSGIQLFTAGHYETEAVVIQGLRDKLENMISNVVFLIYKDSGVETLV